MEALSQQLERFSEVLAAARTAHVRTWDPATVRRALQWARYLRHVYRRFARHAAIRSALERRLQERWGRDDAADADAAAASGLTNFRALERCDLLLAQRLLGNRALGEAAFRCLLQQLVPGPDPDPDPDHRDHKEEEEEATLQDRLALLARRRAAVHLLRSGGVGADPLLQTQAELLRRRLREAGEAGAEGPRRLLGGLWARGPRSGFLDVLAAALLPPPPPPGPPREEMEMDPDPDGRPGSPREEMDADADADGHGRRELLRWLRARPDAAAALCLRLPPALAAAVTGRHPQLRGVYLRLLRARGRRLRYDPRAGGWVGAEAEAEAGAGAWEDLLGRCRSLCAAPGPLAEAALRALEAGRAEDGGWAAPGLSVWTDLLRALAGGGV